MLAGAYAGDLFYDVSGCCGGGDDPGLSSVVFGAATGSIIGSALGAYVVNHTRGTGVGRTLAAALGAVAPAVGLAYLTGKATDSDGAVLVGLIVAQGAFTTLFTLANPTE